MDRQQLIKFACSVAYVVMLPCLIWAPLMIVSEAYDAAWGNTAAILYAGITVVCAHLLYKKSFTVHAWWWAYSLSLISCVIWSFSFMVAAAWVLVPPFELLYVVVGVVFATIFLPFRWKSPGLIMASVAAATVYSDLYKLFVWG